MSAWRKMAGCAVEMALVLSLSQGMAASAMENTNLSVSEFAGENEELRQDVESGAQEAFEGAGVQDSLVETSVIGDGSESSLFGTAGEDGEAADIDTVVLDDIELTLKIEGAYLLQNAEDPGFYYIDTWGGHGIPNMMVGAFRNQAAEGFFDRYTEYMRGSRPDLTVAEVPVSTAIGEKNLEKIVYTYGIQGYTVRDTRYLWLGPNQVLYLFTKREIPELSYLLGNALEDIIMQAAVMQDTLPVPQPESWQQDPQAETTAQTQPVTTVPTQPGTIVSAQTETTTSTRPAAADAGTEELCVKNADSSWTVTTDYYTMTIPPAWTGHFDVSVSTPYDTGYDLKVVNKESEESGFGGHLFTVMLMPWSEDFSYLPSYDYLGTMETPEGALQVVVQYPSDVQTGDMWSVFYEILNGDRNTAITSIRPAEGIVWTLPDGQVIR